ncbi:adenine nucleotide alpha hydrolases-like protein [Aureobasidium pullulans]|uniref:Adenine nucleotide alpha hydrolases-like protein n=1 Tax=Aureobasidium pullulans TaxID=5580 RepID=A0A4S9KJP3_AURPU|nr:adenine nucleotide alpha hydrolases-like protein [Aureobasidium pullulans]
MSLSAAIDQEAKDLRRDFEQNHNTRKKSSLPPLPAPAPDPTTPTSPVLAHRQMAPTTGPRGKGKPAFPGDLGPGDPRRSSRLPGDLGPGDPRRSSNRPANSDGTRSAARSLSPTRGVSTLAPGDKSPAQRRLSDAGSIRPQLGNGGVRLQKDYDNESASSDEESSDEQDTDHESSRGRGRARVGNAVGLSRDDQDSDDEPSPPLSADPTITVTPPSSDQTSHTSSRSKPDVHPSTAFDFAASSTSTPVHSDDEEHLSDLRRAQRLSLNISPIHSTPSAHRVIRQIIRGDYLYFQRQAEEGRRRQRVYLVATDLSSEAEYALEWTIGTVLRDGDTLLAVYAVDEEAGTGGVSEGVEIGHGADVVKDTATIVRSMTAESMTPATLPRDSSTARLAFSERKDMSKAEQDRFRAAEDISQRCVKLLRKTRLQVRVVVEVFHCKSPRHMITEVIDFLSPTLTILGSRGRSQLKGVLLGSFSNYLVTKSSVPVMVARKRFVEQTTKYPKDNQTDSLARLRKHSKQRLHKDGLPVAQAGDGRMRYIRMSNVLEAPGTKPRARGLAGAKID